MDLSELFAQITNIRLVPLNELDSQVFGLRRSGNHAVIDWIFAHYNCTKWHYNNVHLGTDGVVTASRAHTDFTFSKFPGKYSMASFEDYPLNFLKDHLIPANQQILILRDPFNTFASRLARSRNSTEESHQKANEVNEKILEIWKQYAREFVGNKTLDDVLKVNFNDWVQDKDYRKSISKELGVEFTDVGYGSCRGWRFSGGSSFEETDLKVFDRWQNFKDDEEYLSLFDEEMVELSKIIFGIVPDLRLTKASVSKIKDLDAESTVDKAINTAVLLCKQQREEEAERILRQTLKVSPNNIPCIQMLAIIQNNLFRHTEAIETLKKALELDPDNCEHHSNLGMCYSCAKDMKNAIYHGERAVELDRNLVTLNNLGLQYKKAGRTEDAIKLFEEASKLDKDDPHVAINLASAYIDLGSITGGMEILEHVVDKHPGISGAHINLSWCHHFKGWYSSAWMHYEHRLRHFPQCIAYMNKYGEEKKWNGKDSLKDKKLLVFCEQGLGDALQFSRYIKYLPDCHIILGCSVKIARLLETIEGVDEVFYKDMDIEPPEFDYHVPLMSLPLLLDKVKPYTDSNYFKVPEEDSFKLDKSMPVVGLVWKGNPSHPNDENRSMDLVDFYELCKVEGCKFISLQKDFKNYSVMKTLGIDGRYIEECHDFADTARLIQELDLVIAVDTSTLHLAGALGKKVWGLLPYRPDWRWLRGSGGSMPESPQWYPNITLYNQTERGNWSRMMEEVVRDLKLFLHKK